MIRDTLADALVEALAAEQLEVESIHLERPARREHGDWSSNVAMVAAGDAGRPPRDLATALAERLEASPPAHVQRVEVAGPGFVNFHLADSWLHDVLGEVVAAGVDDYARSDLGRGTTVLVEYVSANPTGPLHAGHGRGAAYGDTVARLLERCGYTVRRETYLNDRGTQMQLFAASLAARRAGEEPPADGYQGEYITEWAAEMPADADPLLWGEERAIADQRETLDRMGVRFDTWFSERSMVESGEIDRTLDDLRDRGVTYEADGATWLRSTDFGDDKDRVLVKSDGELTYLAPDIAYHRDKFTRADRLLDVWGADHHGYVARLRAALEALGHDPDEIEFAITQMAALRRDGEPVRLSKRAGDIVELADVLELIGPDAARLTYLMQSLDSPQTIDVDVVTAQSMDNPVYYVQYAHARISSIGKVAAERGVVRRPLDEADLSLLVHERELDLLRSLSELPEVVAAACREGAPHKVTTWVRELAGRFHGFYHDCWVMGEGIGDDLTQARLWLVEASRIGLVVGLDLLGVSAPEEM